jgi:23S rRNA (cytosine1962-C5)-methyltransferase
MKPIKLTKNLTRDIKRGHPWVYKMALEAKSLPKTSGWYRLSDHKGAPLAYGLFDKGSDLAFRVFSVGTPKDPVLEVSNRLSRALDLRKALPSEGTTGFRWVHGEGDLLPGLIIDVFGGTAVIQFDGLNLSRVWDLDTITERVLSLLPSLDRVVLKPQSGKGEARLVAGTGDQQAEFTENGIRWTADVFAGQKTGFFLDQRENRSLIRRLSGGRSVLNLFCYTGGFSVAAGAGGASEVVSVDISSPAIETASQHWLLNALESGKHQALALNAFDFLENNNREFDIVVVDPPAFATSRAAVDKARGSYEKVFAEAAKKVKPGGLLALSSCSRPVDFDIFYEIVVQSLSKARRVGQVLSVSGQPFDHPFPHICPELRYLKFFLLKLQS